jgi:D-alanyl-D-alanine carboxypeptidase/D-alanyl-D-alanine-endopeptidase (penicillin-binding protein 4)
MKSYCFVLFAALIMSGCATTSTIKPGEPQPGVSPLAALSTSPYSALKAQIDATLSDSLFPPANVGIKVVSLATGETLYELNPDMLFMPASNEKLFTSAAALVELGKDFVFTTKVGVDRNASRIHNKGSGDPLLSTADLDSLARVIKDSIQTDSAWTLVGDVSYFDDVPWGEGWMWDDEPESDNMMISPLSVNSNSITVQVRPGKLEDAPVLVRTVPATAYVSIENTATTPVDTPVTPLTIVRKWRERSNTITVTGQLLHRDSLSERHLTVWQPERYVLTLLAERLQSYGFTLRGIEIDSVPSTATPVTEFSHRLDSVLTFLNKVSDNLAAENVLKTLSAERNGKPGTAKSGVSLVKRFLSSIGTDTTKLTMVDGSGLSRYNLTSPNIIMRVLTDIYKRDTLFGTFYNSLPIAGIDGTLSERMSGTSAEGNLRAKTGTLSGVASFSGYVQSANGEMLAFSILMNNYPSRTRMYRQVQDRIGVILSQTSRRSL